MITKFVSALLVLGVIAVTSPITPTVNEGGLEVAEAVASVPESSVIARIGQVVEVIESDSITVAISGSPTLVRASYLFPQYQPLLGDFVYVTKQDAQWAVIGTLSGPINSVAVNPTFESGAVGIIPDGWSITVISSTAGTPTFTQVASGSTTISGSFEGDFGVDSAGVAGTSSADIFSTAVDADEGQRWTAGYWIVQSFIDNTIASPFVGQGHPGRLELFIQFLDVDGVLVSEQSMNSFSTNWDTPTPIYRRASVPQYAVAPAGTNSVRLKIRGTFIMHANSYTSFFLDYMILRRV